MSEGLVERTDEDGVVVLSLNNPSKRNALSTPLVAELDAHLQNILADDSVRAVVVTGQGGTFSAGGDISVFENLDSYSGYEFTKRGYHLLRQLETADKPIIAAVDGYCLAGGLELALACDFIIASGDAKFGLAEIDLGLIAGWGGTVRLGRAVPIRMARQLVYTAARIDAAEAQRIGLVNEVVEGPAADRAIDVARLLASKPSFALKAAKTTLNNAADGAMEAALAIERSLCAALFGSEDVARLSSEWISRSKKRTESVPT
ncbi:enoyl-CoA hydratase/isomerase family protein [Rhodococcus opacus]|uniref:enoyl-CoA hydratase/isomerase family protein n=1 Tax=Rhodococcus opacus TaxID=37919 RepID=UPI002472FB82|nr:enoyl-CoA hydratase/isomerase family protein [Rhodococcus opacus]MDH6293396.1 enoyl-CoA hydratase [Rhodococcus opacus]